MLLKLKAVQPQLPWRCKFGWSSSCQLHFHHPVLEPNYCYFLEKLKTLSHYDLQLRFQEFPLPDPANVIAIFSTIQWSNKICKNQESTIMAIRKVEQTSIIIVYCLASKKSAFPFLKEVLTILSKQLGRRIFLTCSRMPKEF